MSLNLKKNLTQDDFSGYIIFKVENMKIGNNKGHSSVYRFRLEST